MEEHWRVPSTVLGGVSREGMLRNAPTKAGPLFVATIHDDDDDDQYDAQ